MACPVSHIIYAKKYLEKYPSREINADEFILGCVFPDIRRIDASIKRKDTHLCFDPIDLDFAGLSSFQAGWKFHVYCDMRREEILNNLSFYSLAGTAEYWGLANKYLEEIITYEAFNNWEKLVHYFNNVPFFEAGINVSRETFSLWYAIIGRYIERKPDRKSIKIFLSKQPSLAAEAENIATAVEKIQKDDKVVKLLEQVKKEIV